MPRVAVTRERESRFDAWRSNIRRKPGGAYALKAVCLVVGVLLIALGAALVVLPGPLTIPPVLAGVWVLSLEFAWADRLLKRVGRSAREAWESAKKRPVPTALVTVGGLVLAGVVIWAVGRYDLVARARDAVGL